MKTVVVLVDSLNRRFLPCYGNDRVIAPNLERFSERSVCFGRHLVGPAPCMPARETALYGWFDSAVNVADRRYNYLRAAIPSTEPLDFYGCMAGNYDYYWPRSSFALIDAVRFLPYTDSRWAGSQNAGQRRPLSARPSCSTATAIRYRLTIWQAAPSSPG
jgi:hypothetical protein